MSVPVQDQENKLNITRSSDDKRRRISLAVLIVAFLAGGLFVGSESTSSALPLSTTVWSMPFLFSAALAEPAQDSVKDFSKFAHTNASHQRLPCLLCHRRETSSPRPVRSVQHTPCSGCHAQQFAAQSGPICTICHTNVQAKVRDIKPFPTLRSFNMTFAHSQHRNVACTTCHKPASQGVSLSIPSGAEAHNICYQCHAPKTQANARDISSCSTCHKQGQYSRLPMSSKAFKASFSHEGHKRQGLACTECHKITASPARASQVSSPMPTQHPMSQNVQSCESCHNDQRAFGISTFANCKKCHQGPTFKL